jgi:hypothetical protein
VTPTSPDDPFMPTGPLSYGGAFSDDAQPGLGGEFAAGPDGTYSAVVPSGPQVGLRVVVHPAAGDVQPGPRSLGPTDLPGSFAGDAVLAGVSPLLAAAIHVEVGALEKLTAPAMIGKAVLADGRIVGIQTLAAMLRMSNAELGGWVRSMLEKVAETEQRRGGAS